MTQTTESPARAGDAETGLTNALSVGADSIAPKTHVAQAKIALITDEIHCAASQLFHQLNILFAACEANDTAVVIHALRQSQRCWNHIKPLGHWLVAASAERQSAHRQAEGAP